MARSTKGGGQPLDVEPIGTVPPSIVLIGPPGAGKTTLAPLLAERLGFDWVDIDDVREDYYEEIGYDRELLADRVRFGGVVALLDYWKPFEAYAVEHCLADRPTGCVIALGAGHSVHDDPVLADRVAAALAGHPVVLVLPDEDPEEAERILLQRVEATMRSEDVDDATIAEFCRFVPAFVRHPMNERLATHRVVADDETPDATADRLFETLR